MVRAHDEIGSLLTDDSCERAAIHLADEPAHGRNRVQAIARPISDVVDADERGCECQE